MAKISLARQAEILEHLKYDKGLRDRLIYDYVRRKRLRRILQTPSWANKRKIAELYWRAKFMTDETGIPHRVELIIPLKGEQCCGLWVAENMKIVRY